MTDAERGYWADRKAVVQFIRERKMSAWELQRITKELCACGTCYYFVQHYTKAGEALDWGHCCKGNIQHSKKISTASCGFWTEGEEE